MITKNKGLVLLQWWLECWIKLHIVGGSLVAFSYVGGGLVGYMLKLRPTALKTDCEIFGAKISFFVPSSLPGMASAPPPIPLTPEISSKIIWRIFGYPVYMSLNQWRIPIIFTRTSCLAHVFGLIVLPNPHNSILQIEISIYANVKLHSTAAGLSSSAG